MLSIILPETLRHSNEIAAHYEYFFDFESLVHTVG